VTTFPSSPASLYDEPDETSVGSGVVVVHTPQHGPGPGIAKCRSVSRDDRSASERFNDARLFLRWTQEQTAQRYNVTRRTVIRWCNGCVMPADVLLDIEAEAAMGRTGT
jgi:DNA-binding XRE family transcriptional regulator